MAEIQTKTSRIDIDGETINIQSVFKIGSPVYKYQVITEKRRLNEEKNRLQQEQAMVI